MDAVVATAVSSGQGRIDMLVVDGAGLFARGGLRECLDSAWDATRAVVKLAFMSAASAASGPAPSTGRIIYLAPAQGAGEQADAARAGLENLGRTLSTEWARYEITVVTIAPGEATTAGEVAALCAYLASPAGAYFSGCLLDLRGPGGR
jgi:NAD(P)-dependent dehydrogenase (short-subunit alcohol dehydrogenase family)